MPLDEHPGHRHHTQAYCVCVTLPEGKRLMVPCMEIVRFYFGSSSHLIHRLASAPLREDALWRLKSYDARSRHLHLALAPRLSGVSAADIGRIALSPPAWLAAASIHASCVKHASLREPVYPHCGFPLRGKSTLRASGRWLSHAGTPRSTFLVYQLLSCSHPFPFASLSYEVDRAKAFRPRPRCNLTISEEPEATCALLRQSEGEAKLGDRDPNRGRTARVRPRFENAKFPDLEAKPVWLDKLDMATSADILLNRKDGTVELLTFGEPASAGAGRAVDVIAAPSPSVPSQPARHPAFLRRAIREATTRATDRGAAPRVELVTPPGFTEAIFFIPFLIDEDGVVDAVTTFTRSSGGTRQRRGCFLRLSDPTGACVYGLLLALEGSNYREPPTLTEVPAAEITLIARILAKVSIPSPHPSQP